MIFGAFYGSLFGTKLLMTGHDAMLVCRRVTAKLINDQGTEALLKMKVFSSLFVPLAKWSMLLTGNYRCIAGDAPISIRDAVHGDLEISRRICNSQVDALAQRLGADPADQVPFGVLSVATLSRFSHRTAFRAASACRR